MVRQLCFLLLAGVLLAASGCEGGSRTGNTPPTSSVQPDGPAAQVAAFVRNPAHAAAVATAATDTFNKLWDCAASVVRPTGEVRTFANLGQVIFNEAGVPVSGVIVEQVSVSGCGKIKLENVLTASDKSQSKVIPGMPGTTMADPVLVHDSLQYVYLGASKKLGGCKSVRFVDSEFNKFEGAPNPKAKFQDHEGRAWSETWTLNGCGTLIPVTIRYVPDETGTAIEVQSS